MMKDTKDRNKTLYTLYSSKTLADHIRRFIDLPEKNSKSWCKLHCRIFCFRSVSVCHWPFWKLQITRWGKTSLLDHKMCRFFLFFVFSLLLHGPRNTLYGGAQGGGGGDQGTRAPPCNVFLESCIVLTGKNKNDAFFAPRNCSFNPAPPRQIRHSRQTIFYSKLLN